MNWAVLRPFPWLDTRARFVASLPRAGTLLDIGSSDGETLRHIAELRPDLRLHSVDVAGSPESYPPGCRFHRMDVERETFPWADASMDGITCMHLVEHLRSFGLLVSEIARVLKPGGRVYFETPHPKTVELPRLQGKAGFTMNFFDDPTHVRPVPVGELGDLMREAGFEVAASGISRNWIFAGMHPLFCLLPASRKKYTARVHWIGWSAYLIARKIKVTSDL